MASPYFLNDAPPVALIGGGFIGPVHAEALRRIGIPVLGILGSSPSRAARVAQRLGIERVYQNLDDLLGDDRVGSVHIASPNRDHFEQASRVLESGRHVVCEKPLAITAAETGILQEVAAAHPNLASAVNYNIRYYPICREMRARVEHGDLGRIVSVTGSYTQDWLLFPDDYNWRVEPDGGTNLRTIADIGTHWMDLAQFVLGSRISSVFADLATFHPQRFRPVGPSETFQPASTRAKTEPVAISTEDYGAVLLRFDREIRGSFHVSQMVAGRKNRVTIEIAGTEGAMAWDSESPEQLWLGRRGAANGLLPRDPSLFYPEAAQSSHYPGGHAEGFPDTFKQLYLSIYGWVLSDRDSPPPFPTFADGDREVLLCEAIARSALEKTWVEVGRRA